MEIPTIAKCNCKRRLFYYVQSTVCYDAKHTWSRLADLGGGPSSDQKGGILLHATSSIDFSCIEIILTYFDTQELNRHQKIPYHCLSVIRLPLVAKTFRRIRGYRLGSRINGYGYGYGYGMGERIRIRIRIQKNVSVDNSTVQCCTMFTYCNAYCCYCIR
jgi:hypothetical protein